MKPDLRELPKVRDSLSFVYFEHARIEQDGKALTVLDESGSTHVPAAGLTVVMLGPGTTLTHAAMKVLADSGCTVLWVGEEGTRLYGMGHGETRSAKRLLRQVELHEDKASRAAVVLRMYQRRFSEPLPAGLTLEQVRGMEGVRVRTAYNRAARENGVEWMGRSYQRGQWGSTDPLNRALSGAAACLYGICHCAIVSVGYSPGIGFLHTGKMLSFVYDIADLYRMDLVVPVAFRQAGDFMRRGTSEGLDSAVRAACREAFREARLMERVVDDIDDVLNLEPWDIDLAAALVDGLDQVPSALWDPSAGETPGGVNYGGDCSGEGETEPSG